MFTMYLTFSLLLSICGIISCEILPRNPILETVSYLNDIKSGKGKVRVSLTQTQLLIDNLWSRAGCGRDLDPVLCKKCLQAQELFNIVGGNVTHGLDEEGFQKACVLLLYHLENAICKAPDEIARAYAYEDYLYDLVTTTQLDVTQTEIGRFRQYGRGVVGGRLVGLSRTKPRYRVRRFGQVQVHHRPVKLQSIVSLPVDLSFVEEQLDYILHLISQTYKATTQYKCFTAADVFEEAGLEPKKEAAVEDIQRLSSIVISNILHGYCIGESRLVSPDAFIRSVFEDYGTFGTILKRDFIKLLNDLEIGTANHADASWTKTAIHVNKRRKRVALVGAPAIPPVFDNPTKWGEDHPEEEYTECFAAEELLNVFDIHESISVSKFYDMCPAFIQQLTNKACEFSRHHFDMDQSAMIYGWGTLAVFLVTLGSMLGIVLVPLAGVRVYTGLMHLLIALAVSTLSGDALLHLIPEAMGIHVHGVDKPATAREILNKVILVVAAIYIFFLFERLMVVCLGRAPLTHTVEIQLIN
ncbi:zinc transporter ZIP12-like [Amphiura filiformis]|uniref:zinc transporter ZIP12-like n=1 Tax=Amphiura filiformis TaxID=82378 RepID=UPI003B2242FA